MSKLALRGIDKRFGDTLAVDGLELALEEGNLYNKKAWEFSLVRLNQLGYFEQLKPEEDTVVSRNEPTSTVDLTLKVKEKARRLAWEGAVQRSLAACAALLDTPVQPLSPGPLFSGPLSPGNDSRPPRRTLTEQFHLPRPSALQIPVSTAARRSAPAQRSSAPLRCVRDTEVTLPAHWH